MSKISTLPARTVFLLTAFAAVSCAELPELPQLSSAELRRPHLAQSSRIYAADGTLLKTLHGVENRTVVPLGRIPSRVRRAVVAIEDERFYEHDGVDMRAIFRAALANATSGEIREGGSTITQQYVKNVIISPGEAAERTLDRKITEAALARQLEEELGKNEILQRYLNTVYFGNGAYGIQTAAKTYFRKPAEKLTLAEGALLAGLIRSPQTYDPYDNKEEALLRRNLVLEKMSELGSMSLIEVDRAMSKGLGVKPIRDKDRYPAPYFIDYVERLIEFDSRRFSEVLGETSAEREQKLFTGGLRIHTTVDLEVQEAAEEAIDSYLFEKADPYGSLVAIDPQTGYVKAMVGGRDFFARKKQDPYAKLNLAIQHEPRLGYVKDCGAEEFEHRAPGCGRQAGSAYKPFALAAAIRQGVPLSKTYAAQECMSFPAYNWRPCNYEDADLGTMSLLEATINSVNVVYAQLALEIGPEAVVDTAEEMGITTPQEAYASAVLGTNPVNPLNMASAYGTFATNGVRHPPVAITRIEDPRGKLLYEDPKFSKEVLEPGVAYITTTALEAVVSTGTGVNAQLPRPAAGKTGTAQAYRDAWFAGYTPDLVAAVWVGYPAGQISMDDFCPVRFATLSPGESTEVCRPTRIGQVFGGSWPAQIWQRFMFGALAGVPASDFVEPEGTDLITVEIDAEPPPGAPANGCLASAFTPPEDREYAQFVPGTEPTETCREEGELATVPDVVGYRSVGDAIDVLESAGFAVAQQSQSSQSYPPGAVLDQEPDGGTQAAQGTTITLTISTGPEDSLVVPSVLGLSSEEATAELSSVGLNVAVVEEAESNRRKAKKGSGIVWKQSPSSDSEVDAGSTVTIYVNP